MTTYLPPLCLYCRHYDDQAEGFTCRAYPRGIPAAILHSSHDHRKPYRGDKGIRFELRPGTTLPDWHDQRRA